LSPDVGVGVLEDSVGLADAAGGKPEGFVIGVIFLLTTK